MALSIINSISSLIKTKKNTQVAQPVPNEWFSFDTSTFTGTSVKNLGSNGTAQNGTVLFATQNNTSKAKVGNGCLYIVNSPQSYFYYTPLAVTNGTVSIAFWYYPVTAGTNQTILSYPYNGILAFSQTSGSNAIIRWFMSGNGTAAVNSTVPVGVWSHIVWIMIPNGSGGTIHRIYINGVYNTTDSNAATTYFTVTVPKTVTTGVGTGWLGISINSNPSTLNASLYIDDYRLYNNYVLTATDIAYLYSLK